MHVKINGRSIPENTLQVVTLEMGGGSHVRGEAVNQEDRIEVAEILDPLHDNDSIEFDVETRDFRRSHGAGFIRNISKEEQGVGTLMRIRYSFAIQYAK